MAEDLGDDRYCLDVALRQRDGVGAAEGDLGEALEVVRLERRVAVHYRVT